MDLSSIMGMLGGGKGSSGAGGGGGMGWASVWQNPGSGAGPSMISGAAPVTYTAPTTATAETMRPRENASGDFWGPVVMRYLKKYRAQQMAGGGGFDALGGDEDNRQYMGGGI